jgi:hypothetical protein
MGGVSPGPNMSEDERLARQLQDEEEVRARGHAAGGAGSAGDYYSQGAPPNQYAQQGYNASPYGQDQTSYAAPITQDKGKSKGGLLGKLLGKASGSSGSHSQGLPQQHGQYYGGQPGYGQTGYYPPQQGMGMMGRPQRRPGGGMGMGGAAALGVGGGLLGGAMLGSALGDAGDGGGDGGDYGGDGGGDYGGDGGGDFGGGDMGGDMGGGDF